uniref:Uncharacterized protein n=1 Tax=Arundo donax TaxID=35708 RepID=A0A0A9B7X2_ARUDO
MHLRARDNVSAAGTPGGEGPEHERAGAVAAPAPRAVKDVRKQHERLRESADAS